MVDKLKSMLDEVPQDMFEAGIRSSENQLNKLYWMRLIVAVVIRLSLIASVWLVIFDPEKWYAVLLFALLTIILGTVEDAPKISGKEKKWAS